MKNVTCLFVIALVTCCLLLRTSLQSTTCFGVSNEAKSVCGGRGVCVANDTCSCTNGYDGIECEVPICFGLSLYGSQECHCTPDLSAEECEVVCQRYNKDIPCNNNGKCVSPNTCVCNSNYTGSDCSVPMLQCNGVPSTSDNVCSGHGECQASGNCVCDNGFSGLSCGVTNCYGLSSDATTVCASHGQCVAQDQCLCETGYTGMECNIPVCFNMTSSDVCQCTGDISIEECRDIVCANKQDSICSGNGQCVGYNRCKCDNGYKSEDCSVPTVSCFGINELNSTVCSGHGECSELDSCTCNNGYNGSDCSEPVCFGLSENVCSGHGSCTGPDKCVCDNGYNGNKCDKTMIACHGIDNQNANVCNGHGDCTGTDECSCDNGYAGEACEYPVCYGLSENQCHCTPDISAEECSIVCNGYIEDYVSPCSSHGKCVRPDECQCNDGYIGSNCSIADTTCFGLGSQDSNVCSGHGECTSINKCSCEEGFSGEKCAQTSCYGRLSSDPVVCSGHGDCLSKDNCVCDSGWSGLECKYPTCYNDSNTNIYNCECTSDVSSSECSGIVCARNVSSTVCSGYGSCIEPDACLCNPLYTGSSCSRLAFNCFGTFEYNSTVCNGRGSCSGNDHCTCDAGYTGDTCLIPTCFDVSAVSDGVCSDHGNCTGPDECICSEGYSGYNCSVPICFGLNASNMNVCGGAGLCVEPDVCDCIAGYSGERCNVPDSEPSFKETPSNSQHAWQSTVADSSHSSNLVSNSIQMSDFIDISTEVSDSELWVGPTTLPSFVSESDVVSSQTNSPIPQEPSLSAFSSTQSPDITLLPSNIPSDTTDVTYSSEPVQISSNIEEGSTRYSSDPLLHPSLEVSEEGSEQRYPSILSSSELSGSFSSGASESDYISLSSSSIAGIPSALDPTISGTSSEYVSTSVTQEASSSFTIEESVPADSNISPQPAVSPYNSEELSQSSEQLTSPQVSMPAEPSTAQSSAEVSSSDIEAYSSVTKESSDNDVLHSSDLRNSDNTESPIHSSTIQGFSSDENPDVSASPYNSEELSQSSEQSTSPQVSAPAEPSTAQSSAEVSFSFNNEESVPAESNSSPQPTVPPVQSSAHASVTEEFSASIELSQPSDTSPEESTPAVSAHSSVITDNSLSQSNGEVFQSSDLSTSSSEQSPSLSPAHSSSIHAASSDENAISTSETHDPSSSFNNEVSQVTDSSILPQVTVSPVLSPVHSSRINGLPSDESAVSASSTVLDSSDSKASSSLNPQSSETIESSFDLAESSSEVIEKPTIVVISSRNVVDGGVSRRHQDIYIELDATPAKESLRWMWTVFEKDTTLDLAASLGDVNNSTFIIPALSLDAGKKYVIKVAAQYGEDTDTQAFMSWTITMSTPPSVQYVVTPSEGISLDTIFTIEADSTEESLQYQVEYLNQGVFRAIAFSSSSNMATILPSGTGTNHELTLQIIASRSDGDYTATNKTVIVHPLTSQSWETIEAVSISSSETNIDFVYKLIIIGKEVKTTTPTSAELATAIRVAERLTSKLLLYVNNFSSMFSGTDLIASVSAALSPITSNKQVVNKQIAESALSILESILSAKKATVVSDDLVVTLFNIIDNVATFSDVKSDQLIDSVTDMYFNSKTGMIDISQESLSLRLANLNKNDASLYSPATLQTNRVSARALSNANQVEITLNQALRNHPDLSTHDNVLLQYVLYSYYSSGYEVSDKHNFTLVAPIVKLNAKTSDNIIFTSPVRDLVTIVFPAVPMTNMTSYFPELDSNSQVSQVCSYWNGNKWDVNEEVCYRKSDSSSEFVTCQCSKLVVVSVALVVTPETVEPETPIPKRNGLSPGGVAGVTIAVVVPVLIGVVILLALAAVIIFKYATRARMNTKKIAMHNIFHENFEMHDI